MITVPLGFVGAAEGGSSTVEIVYLWVAIVALIGLVFLLISYPLRRKSPESTWASLFRDLGITCLIPTTTFMVADRARDFAVDRIESTVSAAMLDLEQKSKVLVDDVREATLHSMLAKDVGRDVADEIIRQTIRPAFQYTDYEVNGSLSVVRPSGVEDAQGGFVECTLRTEFTVTNRDVEPHEWPIQQRLSDIVPGARVILSRVRVQALTADGRPGTLEHDLHGEALQSRLRKVSVSEYEFVQEPPLTIQPGASYRLLIEKTVDEALVGGDLYQRVRFPCKSMKVTLLYDNDELTVNGGFLYPHELAGFTRLETANGVAKAELTSVALPQQGIYFKWEPVQ